VIDAVARAKHVDRGYRAPVGATHHRYGDLRWQVGDLWLPRLARGDEVPVVALLHGGYWRSAYTKRLLNGLAQAVVARGWAAWNIEYRRVGPFGGGGGWPMTFADVRLAVDHVQQLPGVDPSRLVTCGHSAGGQLALWVAARSEAAIAVAGTAPVVQPCGAVSLAGVVDLEQGAELGLGGGAVCQFLGGSPEQHLERYRSGSPAALLPLGVSQVLVHGLSDVAVPPSMSQDYQRAASDAGDDARYVPIEGLGHREIVDPSSTAWPVIAGHLERLLSD
jgi:acetyl esterase/lipase